MATTPMSIQYRPFSVEPNTGIMLPDGIFDTAIFEQQITAYYTNNSSSDLKNVSIYFESISDNNIVVTSKTHFFHVIPAGASVKVFWLGNFQHASFGKKNISIIAKANGHSLKREIKQIFVSKTTYNQISNTYTCQIPEGSIQVKILGAITERKSRGRKVSRFPALTIPTRLELTVLPNPPYKGQFGDLPFQDPWWKVVGWVVAAVAAIGAVVAAALGEGKASVGVSGNFDETGKVNCCKPNDGLSVKERQTVAGVLSTIASGAVVVGCSDDIDPWRRGQEATPVKEGEITISESLKLNMKYIEPPKAGKAYPIEVEWIYTRVTNLSSYSFHVKEIKNNIHTLKQVQVDTPKTVKLLSNDFIIRAKFIKEDNSLFKGTQLHAFALVVSPKKDSYIIPLLDDGIGFDKKANDGVYTGFLDFRNLSNQIPNITLVKNVSLLGTWQIYVYAQDTNDATIDMKPEVAATHIGGMVVASASEFTFNSSEPCPFNANSSIVVIT
ncbi:MAG: hypothetical protein MUC49_21090 [Raineya sp.]|jgi:hypothetical protein|nr:hypothetical protein [Raineya sp.]